MAILTLGAASAADDNATEDTLASEISVDENIKLEDLNADETNLQDDFQATEKLEMSANESAVGGGQKTFDSIQTLIDNSNKGDVINISGTYVRTDSAIYVSLNGDKSVTINGNDDATLDARGLGGIVYVYEDSSITFKNVKFINAANSETVDGFGEARFEKCTFMNCAADYTNTFQSIVAVDSKFIDCSSEDSYLMNDCTLTNCEITRCNASDAIMSGGEANGCKFTGCLVGGDEICFGTEQFNCTFNGCRENINFEEEKMVKEFTINFTGKGYINEKMTAYVYLPYGVEGELTIYTDEEGEENALVGIISSEPYPFEYDFRFNKPNVVHKVFYRFESYDGEIVKSGSKSYAKTTNYVIYVDVDYGLGDFMIYGQTASVDFDLPSCIEDGTVSVYVGDELVKEFDMEMGVSSISIDNVTSSQLAITVRYNGDGSSGLAKKSFTETLDVAPLITVPTFSFNDDPEVTITYEKSGDSIVIRNYDDDTVIFTGNMSEGKITCDNFTKFGFGEGGNYIVEFKNRTYEFDIFAGPAISLPQEMSVGDDYNFTVEFPENLRNWDLEITIGDSVLFSGKLTNTRLNLTLPANLDDGSYSIYFEATDGVYDQKSYSFPITIYEYPKELDFYIDFPDYVAIGNEFAVTANLPWGVGGKVTLWIDGIKIGTEDAGDSNFYIDDNDYAEGIHTYKISYSGTEYYNPITENGTFEIKPYVFVIPESAVIAANDETISGYFQVDADALGTVTIYANGKKYATHDIADAGTYVPIYIEAYLYEGFLSLGNNSIRILYKDEKGRPVYDNTSYVYLDYTIRFEYNNDKPYFTYGNENSISVMLPLSASTDKLTILVNGNEYRYWDGINMAIINVTDQIGEFTVTARYNGDDVYTHPVEINHTFISKPEILYPDHMRVTYKDASEVISLMLPDNASGKLIVTVDRNPYAEAGFVNGLASVNFADMSFGSHKVTAYYSGTDYEVEQVDFDVDVIGIIMVEGLNEYDCMNYSGKLKIYLQLPEDAKGTLVVECYNFNDEVPLENGYGEIIVKGSDIGVGKWDIYVYYDSYDDPESYSVDTYEDTITVIPIIKVSNTMTVFGANTVSIDTKDAYVGGRLEILYDNVGQPILGSFEKELEDGKASISLSSLTAGKHNLVITYYDDYGDVIYSMTETVTVKEAKAPKLTVYSLAMFYRDGSKFKAKVIDKNGKVVKNKFVKIYINGKLAKSVKTDAKGFAYYSVPNLPGKYKVYVQYGTTKSKATTITVKQPMLLKLAYVKQSAKKLVLTATLKSKNKANKWITFKFNGVTLKGKTNSKGVASVTVKQAVLKKLKVGKKVTYTATYVRTTLKKTVLVRK